MNPSKSFNPQCVCGGSVDAPNSDCERCSFQSEIAALSSQLAEATRARQEAEEDRRKSFDAYAKLEADWRAATARAEEAERELEQLRDGIDLLASEPAVRRSSGVASGSLRLALAALLQPQGGCDGK